MSTIQATVNPRLLPKADRLFTGTLQGRVIEILQNARRAGATEVAITNHNCYVTVHDNGRGIEDFANLLDLGGSGWDDACEASEDPAGVGIFCLAPRQVTIRSLGKTVTIEGDGWRGATVPVQDDPDPVEETWLQFPDEAWTVAAVERNAVFSGLQVTVDGAACTSAPFVSERAIAHPELGCQIEVRESADLDPWHCSCNCDRYHGANALVNFHGQVVPFDYHEIGAQNLYYLVDLTGEPTGIRLMLPARTRVVENEAFASLRQTLEVEGYRYLQRRGHHRLPYKQYLRARELGIELPEAKPTYAVGLLAGGDAPEPVAVTMPDDFPLAKCYRFDQNCTDGTETDETNLHLLAALGEFGEPFVPVHIHPTYHGYAWAELPTIGKVEVSVGRQLHSGCLWTGTMTCVASIAITAHASDGRVFSSEVCMAKAPAAAPEAPDWAEDHVLVTPQAQQRLCASEIWYHFGGWSDEGDTYDTQMFEFEEQLDHFWLSLAGPEERLRQGILASLAAVRPEWQTVTVTPDGSVAIEHLDGTRSALRPPPSP